jgi:hypothetical protein
MNPIIDIVDRTIYKDELVKLKSKPNNSISAIFFNLN